MTAAPATQLDSAVEPPVAGEEERAASSTRPRTASRSTVKNGLTPYRQKRVVENAEFTAFGSRILRATGRRVAAGDVDALPALAALSAELDAAISDAVTGLRGAGYSWREIAVRLGITRQAAHQRWAGSTDGARPADGDRPAASAGSLRGAVA